MVREGRGREGRGGEGKGGEGRGGEGREGERGASKEQGGVKERNQLQFTSTSM